MRTGRDRGSGGRRKMRQPNERRCSTCFTGVGQHFTLMATSIPCLASRATAFAQQYSLPPQGTYSLDAMKMILLIRAGSTLAYCGSETCKCFLDGATCDYGPKANCSRSTSQSEPWSSMYVMDLSCRKTRVTERSALRRPGQLK